MKTFYVSQSDLYKSGIFTKAISTPPSAIGSLWFNTYKTLTEHQTIMPLTNSSDFDPMEYTPFSSKEEAKAYGHHNAKIILVKHTSWSKPSKYGDEIPLGTTYTWDDQDSLPWRRTELKGISNNSLSEHFSHFAPYKTCIISEFKLGDIVQPNGSCRFLSNENCTIGTIIDIHNQCIYVQFSPSNITVVCHKSEIELAVLSGNDLSEEDLSACIEDCFPMYETIQIKKAGPPRPQDDLTLWVRQSALDKIGRHNIQFLADQHYRTFKVQVSSCWLEDLALNRCAYIAIPKAEIISVYLSPYSEGEHIIVLGNSSDKQPCYASHISPWMTYSYKEALIDFQEGNI